jgi:hypothetical protein
MLYLVVYLCILLHRSLTINILHSFFFITELDLPIQFLVSAAYLASYTNMVQSHLSVSEREVFFFT